MACSDDEGMFPSVGNELSIAIQYRYGTGFVSFTVHLAASREARTKRRILANGCNEGVVSAHEIESIINYGGYLEVR